MAAAAFALALLVVLLASQQVQAQVFINNVNITASSIEFNGGGTSPFTSTNSLFQSTGGNVYIHNHVTFTSTDSEFFADGGDVTINDITTIISTNDQFRGQTGSGGTLTLDGDEIAFNSVLTNPTITHFQTARLWDFSAITITSPGFIMENNGEIYLEHLNINGGPVQSGYLEFRNVNANNFQWTQLDDTHQNNNRHFRVSSLGLVSTIQDSSFTSMTYGVQVDSGSTLRHQGGTNVFGFVGRRPTWGQYNLAQLSITGPAFDLGASNGFWRLSGSTFNFNCSGSSQSSNETVVRTASAQNCIDVTPAPSAPDPFWFYCDRPTSENALMFFPRMTVWDASYSNDDNRGPRICGSSTSLVPVNGPKVINGVSFSSTIKFQLTNTFTFANIANPHVAEGDFYLGSVGHSLSVREVAQTSNTNLWTHVYEITVEAACDGLLSLRYKGTIGGNLNNNNNQAGMQPRTARMVYAGCLGTQFCL